MDILANLLLGADERAVPLPPPASGGFRAALDAVLVDALLRPPCVVSFSGGRDSSAILALACRAARRHGLALPIPAIMRFPGDERSEESSWQELVLTHLRLANAEIIELHHELDALGPFATAFLRRNGLIWPGNVHIHAPILELARGGTLLTGVGGDELFSTSAPRRSSRAAALGALPRSLRAEILLRRRPAPVGRWLTPAGRSELRRALTSEEVSWPYRWDRSLDHWYASRAFAALDGVLTLLARDSDVAVVNPLLDRQVLSELRRVGGRRGFPNRAEAMRWLCGGLLPAQLLARTTKASFGGPLWGPSVRAFADRWDGSGVDQRYVDTEVLRIELSAPEPDFRTIMLVHQAWLATEGESPPIVDAGRWSPSAASTQSASGQNVEDQACPTLDRGETRPPAVAPRGQRQQREQPSR